MNQIDLSVYPFKEFYVRKRKNNSKTYLIYLTKIFEVNSFSEQVWDLCTGKHTVLEIISIVAASNSGSFHDVVEDVTLNLVFYEKQKLIAI